MAVTFQDYVIEGERLGLDHAASVAVHRRRCSAARRSPRIRSRMAAIARAHETKVATGSIADFQGMGLEPTDPGDASGAVRVRTGERARIMSRVTPAADGDLTDSNRDTSQREEGQPRSGGSTAKHRGSLIEPADSLRPTRSDAVAVLALRCLRTLWLVVFAAGATVAVVTHRLDDRVGEQLDTPVELARSLTTPLAGLALAVALRLVVALVALVLALPLTVSNRLALSGAAERSRWQQVADRWRLTSCLQSLRWTWAVRDIAAVRAGPWGPRLIRVDSALRVLSVGGFMVFVVAAVVTGT